MPFDIDLFMLYGATKKETLKYLRKQAQAGKTISPRALAKAVDILDPKAKGGLAGRPKAKPPIHALMWAGRLKALHKHGFIRMPSDELPRFIAKNLNKGASGTTEEALRRALLNPDWRIFADYAYLEFALLLYAMGKTQKIKLLKTNTNEQINATITGLLLEESITQLEADRIREALK